MSISRDLDSHRGDLQPLEVLEEDRHQHEAVVVIEVHHLGLVFLPESLEHVDPAALAFPCPCLVDLGSSAGANG